MARKRNRRINSGSGFFGPCKVLRSERFRLICLVKKRKFCFRILLDLRVQSWIFLKKRILDLGEISWLLYYHTLQRNNCHLTGLIETIYKIFLIYTLCFALSNKYIYSTNNSFTRQIVSFQLNSKNTFFVSMCKHRLD